jgi:transposase-like protein
MAAGTEAAVAELSERRGERSAAGGPPLTAVSDPEVPAKPTRRRFTAEYKLRILRESERQSEPGAIGALLRREGLYSTHLSAWRRQRDRGALDALRPRRRGRKPDPTEGLRQRIAELESEQERLEERLRQAEAIITAQKKLSEILGLPMATAARRESA